MSVATTSVVLHDGHHPSLGDTLLRNRVIVPAGHATDELQILRSIEAIDYLIEQLQKLDPVEKIRGDAPGFETRGSSSNFSWFDTNKFITPYQVLASLNSSIQSSDKVPQPSPSAAIPCFKDIKASWEHRRNYLLSDERQSFCSCIREWEHVNGDVLLLIANQSLEQAMVKESSDCVNMRLRQPGFKNGQAWDKLYEPHSCAILDKNMYAPHTPLRIITGRDDYIANFSWLAMQAKSTIEVATCYLFSSDPAVRYIMCDLLPFVALRGRVKVRLLVDLMTVESAIFKSAFTVSHASQIEKSRGGYAPFSFLSTLPNGCPEMSEHARTPSASPLDFYQKILDIAAATPNFQVRWWCARDAQDGYRVKNHAKSATFDAMANDGGVALIGGSNVVPLLVSGDSDCDLMVSGRVARKINETFEYLWSSLDTSLPEQDFISCEDNQEEPSVLSLMPHQKWLDDDASVALVRSEPCSSGEDAVLRHVLGAIAVAKETILMCFGHCNFPMSLALALREATMRGVKAKLLVNSLYSSDLRVNQRDMFMSLKQLLNVAPDVEVWSTALPSMRRGQVQPDHYDDDNDNGAPPFVHAKYTVVDSRWVAVGSWNVWPRSAFYEIEHELLVQSEIVAAALGKKFEKEREATSVRLFKADECQPGAGWCPKGCNLCLPYGPFYVDL